MHFLQDEVVYDIYDFALKYCEGYHDLENYQPNDQECHLKLCIDMFRQSTHLRFRTQQFDLVLQFVPHLNIISSLICLCV